MHHHGGESTKKYLTSAVAAALPPPHSCAMDSLFSTGTWRILCFLPPTQAKNRTETKALKARSRPVIRLDFNLECKKCSSALPFDGGYLWWRFEIPIRPKAIHNSSGTIEILC
jgi:hypothetical protein